MIDTSFTIRANGKLLLTGEYFVLDGALALAVPVIYGQRFSVMPADGPAGSVEWASIDNVGNNWFKGLFHSTADGTASYSVSSHSDENTAQRIIQLLDTAAGLQPELAHLPPIRIETRLEFPRTWGLGSSSTLVHGLASWLDIDPYLLLESSFGGSGYDLACAGAGGPILYRLEDGRPVVEPIRLDWPFRDHLHFIHLENKQDSREGIWHYQNHLKGNLEDAVSTIDRLTRSAVDAADIHQFMAILDEHEAFVARSLDLARVMSHRFPDFNGSIKSLGAWGGDFALAASTDDPDTVFRYFAERGYPTVISWHDLVIE
jgi:mevalonate kinase